MSKNKNKLIRRFNLSDMLMHWAVAIGFMILLITGYLIFFDGSAKLLNHSAGNASRMIHKIGALLFVAAPLIYFIFSKNRFGFLTAFKYNKSDVGWLKSAMKHYFAGGSLPPQGKYNTGQKLYYLFAVVCGVLLAFTGFAMWFDWFGGTAGLVMIVIHDIAALALAIFFAVHVYLSVFHPHERKSFNAMVTGYMDREYAEEGHEIWVNEVEAQEEKGNGEKRPNHKRLS